VAKAWAVPQLVMGIVLVVLTAIGCSARGERVTRGGPLACSRCQGDDAMPMDVGTLGTYGAANLQNHGNAPVVLERVAYLHRTPGLLLLGPIVAKNSGVGLIREFPPHRLTRKLNTLEGAKVPPFHDIEDDVDILVGVSPLRKGSFSYNGVEVYYRVGRKQYVATFDEGVRVCAPASVPLGRCQPPVSIK
jgi:hypothetical protein